jgi:hypothetical protein
MDPNANLAEQLQIARRLSEGHESPQAERLADLVIALDEWIRIGGFLPDAWDTEPKECDCNDRSWYGDEHDTRVPTRWTAHGGIQRIRSSTDTYHLPEGPPHRNGGPFCIWGEPDPDSDSIFKRLRVGTPSGTAPLHRPMYPHRARQVSPLRGRRGDVSSRLSRCNIAEWCASKLFAPARSLEN